MFKKIASFLKSLRTSTKILLGALAMLWIAGPPLVYYLFFSRTLPKPINFDGEILRLNNDAWTEDERQRYYHLSQGSQFMPYDWFVALEQGDNNEPFIADDNITRFRAIPDPSLVNNPDRLPIGFAKDDPDAITGVVNIGVTCAACHTAQMTYKGKIIRIDGAPGMLNFDSLLPALITSLAITEASSALIPDSKFNRFARKVLKDNYSIENALKLKKDVGEYLAKSIQAAREESASDKERGETPTRGGFGRIDGFGAGGNRLYRQLDVKNLRTLNAPVKAIPLWNTYEYNWVQSNGSIRQPMARNIIQALAVNASLIFPGDPAKNDRYISSVRLNNMFEMETTIQKFKAPVWPENILGKLDAEAIKRGETLYQSRCAFCHEPKKETQPEPDDATAIKNNKTFFVLRLFPADKLKTDPMDAKNFAERRLDASSIQMGKDVAGAEIISMVLSGIIKRQYDELNLPLEAREEWNGYRDNLVRTCTAYSARPLAGVWASAPYLHNGSVPSLYQLLLPAAERDKVFFTGNMEFDPVNVGYVTKEFSDGFRFDTSITGNSNAGHEYSTSLKHEERMDLIEYLKSMKFPEKDFQLIDPQSSCGR